MSVIVSKGNSPHNVSSGAPETSDSVVSGGSMFVLSGGTAFATTVSSGGFLTINKGGSGSGSILSGGSERVSGTEIGALIQSGGSQRVFASGKVFATGILGNGVQDVSGVASSTTVGSRGLQNVDAFGTAFGTTVSSGGLQSVHSAGKTSGTILNPFGQEDVGPFGLAVSTTVNSGATLTISSGGTTSGATIGNGGKMFVSAGGVAADVTLNFGAVTSNAGIIKANSSATAVVGGVVTNANTIEALGSGALVQIFASVTGSGSGTILAVGIGARVELNGATISGGKLQTKSGGRIDVDVGVLSGATIVSGSVVDIGDADTLTLVGSAVNSGVISMLGSANPATLAISGAVVLSGGGKMLLGSGGNNRIVAAAGGATLSNVNNTIAGAGNIGPGGNLTVVNAGSLEGTTSGTLFLNTNISNTSTGVILASGVAARVGLNGATISGGKLQTLAGGEIDADFGSLTDTTIASGSVVKINDGDTLILSGLINNLGVISAVGSANPAHLTVAGTVVLSGGGKVSLSSSGNNHIGAVSSASTLSNVNNTIAGAGVIDFGLAVVNGGKLEATTSNTLNLQANVSNTALGTILASGSGARVALVGNTISGGKLQTLAGGEIDANGGTLTETTIASGSLVKINDGNALILLGHINNLGVISAAGSTTAANLAISGAVVLSGGGKVSLSSSGNNHIRVTAAARY
jgi:autotransporter passenger strand-loop-strand repeat protein